MGFSLDEAKAPKLWGWQTALSILVTLAILGGLALTVDMKTVWRHASASDKRWLLLGLAAHYATYPLRGGRWKQWLTRFNGRAGWGKFALVVFFYNAVDNVVPAKLGDVYGAHLVRINCGVRRSIALGALAFIRMVDAWLVLLAAVLASSVLFSSQLPRSVVWALSGGCLIALLTSCVLTVFLVLHKRPPAWLPEGLYKLVEAFHSGMWPERRQVPAIGLMTILIWTLEAAWLYWLTLAFDLHFDLVQVVFLTMVPVLASVFPLTPSGAGVVEVTLYSCLRLLDVTAPVAVSVTVMNRFIDYWLHIGLGALLWAVRKRLGLRTFRELPEPNPSDGAIPSLVKQVDVS